LGINLLAESQHSLDTPFLFKNEEEKIDWLRLIRSDNVGPLTFFSLLKQFKSAAHALEMLPYLAKKGGYQRSYKPFTREQALEEIEKLHKFNGSLIAYGEENYPSLLSYITDFPPLLSVKGNLSLLKKESLAIVGARNASLNGKIIARKIAESLLKHNYVITSGLARGIDTAAHEASISLGTIAALAGGLDSIYPSENERLYHQIAEAGLLISEMPFGASPQAGYFPRRNRLIAGVSKGIVIIEAAIKSGSLITAQRALDYGRDLFVVPGSPFDPRYQGSNRLIREGATLIQNADDVIEGLKADPYYYNLQEKKAYYQEEPKVFDTKELEKARTQIIENLSFSPIGIDELIQQCHFSTHIVMAILLELEIAGKVIRSPFNQVALRIEDS
jgi:DNA processing protein